MDSYINATLFAVTLSLLRVYGHRAAAEGAAIFHMAMRFVHFVYDEIWFKEVMKFLLAEDMFFDADFRVNV